MVVGPPVTRTDEYLSAILDELRASRAELCALRAAVEDGQAGPATEPVGKAVPVDGMAAKPTKRTRQRPPRQS